VVLMRTWLCSASRGQQPNRDSAPSQPVSGIPASPAAYRRLLASFRPPGGRVPAQSHAGPSRQRYPIEITKLTQRHPNHRTPPTVRETHLAKNTLKCVSQFRSTAANNRKRVAYKLVIDNSTHADKMRHPHGVPGRSGAAGLRSLKVVKAP